MLVAAEKANLDMSDFGKNVSLNSSLETGESVYAYEFNGYWKTLNHFQLNMNTSLRML